MGGNLTNVTDRVINKRIGAAALIVSGGVLLSRLLGVVREAVFAGLLGADAATDQYVAAFRLPDFLNYLLAGGFLAITFIPIFSRYLADEDEEAGWEAFGAIARPVTAGIVILVVIGMVLARQVIELLYPNFTADQIATTTRYTRIALPAQMFFVVGGLLTAVQYAKGEFRIPTLAPVVYNIAIIAGGVVFAWATDEPSPEGFVWGALAGAALGNFAIQLWGARRVGLPGSVWRGRWAHPVVTEYLTIAVPLMIGQSIVVLDETLMSVFGDLAGDGAQTHLQYARRTMFVPIGIIAQAAGVAAYPFLARLHAEGRNQEMARTVARTLKYVVALSIAAAALLAALSQPTIRLLFERGAFGADDTVAAATALFFYALAIPLWGALQILTRGFYAARQMWVPVVAGTAATVVAIPVYWWLQRSFGLRGVALASVLVLTGYTVALAVVWFRRTDESLLRPIVETALRSVPLAVVGAGAAWMAAKAVDVALDGFIGAMVSIFVGTAVFAGAVLLGGRALFELSTATMARTETTEPAEEAIDQS